jgi:membrane associated rhomboid family serine protease
MSGFKRTPLGEVIYSLPPAVRWILISCVAIWFAELTILSFQWQAGIALIFEWLALVEPIPWLWQLVTYAFLHDPGGIFHVGFNMFMLWMFGRELERRWGTASFLQFYLLCAVGAGICHAAVMAILPSQLDQFGNVLPAAPVVGASGAIMGLFAAYGMIFPERTLLLFLVFPMKAKYVVLLLAFVELAFAFQLAPSHGVANLAHLGGMLTAWIYLKHGWRLTKIKPIQALKDRIAAAGRARRASKFKVIDEKQWDAWLDDDSTDETQH